MGLGGFQVVRAVGRFARHAGRGLLDATLPQTCVACGAWIAAGGRLACEACHAQIMDRMVLPYCPRCGRTLPQVAIHPDGCARCRSERFWNVAGVARVGLYEPALRATLLGLKYSGQERNAEYVCDLLAAELRLRGWTQGLAALVPVPMHWLRRWQRPCDHARVLAEALGRRLHVPVVRLVRRARHGPSQTRMQSKQERLDNVRGCFAPPRTWWPGQWGLGRWWRGRWGPGRLAGQTVCIVDNLAVTGATLCEVSKVLRRAGAKRIYAAVVARSPAPGDPPSGLPEMPDAGAAVQLPAPTIPEEHAIDSGRREQT